MDKTKNNIEIIKSINDEHIQEYIYIILADIYNDWKDITPSRDSSS